MPGPITAEILRDLLHYDPETGLFIWKVARYQSIKPGMLAGSLTANGYVQIWIDGHNYLASRLAWLYIHGSWPLRRISHRDRDRANNRLANLRPATGSQSCANSAGGGNESGFKGVFRNHDRWIARVVVRGRRHHLGAFGDPRDAARAYDVAAVEHFGEFACTNAMLGLL